MFMMCEHDNLGSKREVCQGVKSSDGAVVVKLDQDVIHDQGNRIVLFEVGFEAGQAKGQVELISGSQAEPGDADRISPAGTDSEEHCLVVVIIIDSQALE